MKTSQNDIRLIENYLKGRLPFIDKLLFESRVKTDPVLKRDLYFQKKSYRLIKIYHREKLKEELEALHITLFNNPDKMNFRQNIFTLFKNL